MILLDTNVLSELMRPAPHPRVLKWMDMQPGASLWTTAITLMEIHYGLLMLPGGARRSAMLQGLEIAVRVKIEDRIAAFDTAAAERAGDVMAQRHKQGRPVEVRDTMIAGIALARNATLATRNIAHFEDLSVPVVNPWAN